MIREFQGILPDIDSDVFIAETATIIGDVRIGRGSSIWYGAVLRGDMERITIGINTNIQDNATVHADSKFPTDIGNYTVVGHNTVIHGCTIGSNCLIGMGAVILDGAFIGDNCIIGAGAMVTKGKKIPPNSLVLGVPGAVMRQINDDEMEAIRDNALSYSLLAKKYTHE
ncbi:MAG: gamma carbonic anhydrase family protein [Tissierellia bacterium]|nr:gamma carbonic anhydrase family protein [Tissierellia bacterium]